MGIANEQEINERIDLKVVDYRIAGFFIGFFTIVIVTTWLGLRYSGWFFLLYLLCHAPGWISYYLADFIAKRQILKAREIREKYFWAAQICSNWEHWAKLHFRSSGLKKLAQKTSTSYSAHVVEGGKIITKWYGVTFAGEVLPLWKYGEIVRDALAHVDKHIEYLVKYFHESSGRVYMDDSYFMSVPVHEIYIYQMKAGGL